MRSSRRVAMANRAMASVRIGVYVLACAVVPFFIRLGRPTLRGSGISPAWFYVGLLQGMAFGSMLCIGTFGLVRAAKRSTSSRLLVAAALLPGLLAMLGALLVLYSDPVFKGALPAGTG
jgi:hypothetical protein